MRKERVVCYIDGFNLYHSIDDLYPPHHPQRHVADSLKWLNLWELASAFIQPSKEDLVDVFYFTALAHWLSEPKKRHEEFIRANQSCGVSAVLGHFKNKPGSCKKCGARWTSHEEKQSDVNIAAYLIHHAHLDRFDKALVLSADSDLCPAIQLIIDDLPHKKMAILVPPNRYRITRELRGIVPAHKIKQKHLNNNLLPQIVRSAGGDIIARCPDKYHP